MITMPLWLERRRRASFTRFPVAYVDLTIVAASTVKASDAKVGRGYAGEAITSGQWVYKKTADGLYWKTDCDASTTDPAASRAAGLAINSALIAGSPVEFVRQGDVDIGTHGVAIGTTIVLSGTAGGCCPDADLAANDWVSKVATIKDANTITIDIVNTEILHG